MSAIPVEHANEISAGGECVFPKAQACGAKTRSGGRCKLPAVQNHATGLRKRCQRHGGRSTGPRTPIMKHGRYSKAFKTAQCAIREKLKALRKETATITPEVAA